LHFLEKHGADLTVNSDELRPDDAFININNSTVYIIEKEISKLSWFCRRKASNLFIQKETI